MSTDPMPVWWLCGPPGVGKTTTGWNLYNDLARAGRRTGYLDIDQLGMLAPPPTNDPDRDLLKARALAAVAPNYRAAGARLLVVSGVVDPYRAREHAELVGPGGVTLCLLRLSPEELDARLTARGWNGELLQRALAESEALNAGGFADVVVDTDGLLPEEVTRRVRTQLGTFPAPGAAPSPARSGSTCSAGTDDPASRTEAVLICGSSGVGKSTVGWHLFGRYQSTATPCAFLDLQQIGFLTPAAPGDPDGDRLKTRNLSALWSTFRAHGARRLIINGWVAGAATLQAYRQAVAPSPLTVVRLDASDDELRRRILLRREPGGPRLPGDPLTALPLHQVDSVARRSVDYARALRRAGLGDLFIDTTGHTADQVVEDITTRLSRPSR